MPKPGYYAVRVGRIPGIYDNWVDCEKQVKGFPGAVYKKFPTTDLAQFFLNNGSSEEKRKKSTVQTKQTESQMNILPHEIDYLFNDDFGETLESVITSTSNLVVPVPKITYSSSSKSSYYAVHRGKKPGVYRTWTECETQIRDFKNASYRKFNTEEEAVEYVRTGGIQKATKREIENLEISNEVIKKRKTSYEDFEYVLKDPTETVVIFTDGASSHNGKKKSRAGIGVYWGPNHPLNTSKRIKGRQTNNRAEIYAAVHALNQAKLIGAKNVKLYTDSQFIIHSITDWINKWQANGWKLVTGQEVTNKEDFIALNAAREGLNVEWIYVKAHARNKGNDEADKLAVAGSKLLLEPENYSEFQEIHIKKSDRQISDNKPFLLTTAAATPEEVLPLVLPDKPAKNFYAVYRGRNPGVYATWTECEKQIKDFPKSSFRKFSSEEEAKMFVKTGKITKQVFQVPECKDTEFVTVFTDGASSSNGQEGARSGIGVYWGPGNPLNTSMRLPGRQTNNRAEIFAAVHALRQAKQLGIKNVRLYTDSQFVIKGITIWIKKWKENGWKLANGKPVINKDDFITLENAAEGLNVDWCYVKGHDNNPGNVEADQLAVAGCNKSLSETIVLN